MVPDPLYGLNVVAKVSKGTSQERLIHVGVELKGREGGREGGKEGREGGIFFSYVNTFKTRHHTLERAIMSTSNITDALYPSRIHDIVDPIEYRKDWQLQMNTGMEFEKRHGNEACGNDCVSVTLLVWGYITLSISKSAVPINPPSFAVCMRKQNLATDSPQGLAHCMQPQVHKP